MTGLACTADDNTAIKMAETGTSDGKKRKPNWSKDECLQLTELVKQRKTLIEGKFGSGLTSAHRQEAWQTITDNLNSRGSVKRTKEETEKKWKNMKSSGKKSYSTFHRATTATGGGPPPTPLSPVTDNVTDVIGRENEILTGINQTMDSTMLQILNMQPAQQGFCEQVCEPSQVFHIPCPSPQLYEQVPPQPQLPQPSQPSQPPQPLHPLHALMRERLQLEVECLQLKKRYLMQKLNMEE